MKYRKKPIVIEAVRCSEAIHNFGYSWKDLPKWLEAAYEKGGVIATAEGIHLPTLEGSMLARPEDLIICGVNGEIYPCKPDIFEKTYELVQ